MSEAKNEYEAARERRIRENREKLAALGLRHGIVPPASDEGYDGSNATGVTLLEIMRRQLN